MRAGNGKRLEQKYFKSKGSQWGRHYRKSEKEQWIYQILRFSSTRLSMWDNKLHIHPYNNHLYFFSRSQSRSVGLGGKHDKWELLRSICHAQLCAYWEWLKNRWIWFIPLSCKCIKRIYKRGCFFFHRTTSSRLLLWKICSKTSNRAFIFIRANGNVRICSME